MAFKRLGTIARSRAPDLGGVIVRARDYLLSVAEKATDLTQSSWPLSVCVHA